MAVYGWLLSHVQTAAWNHKIIQQEEFVPHLAHSEQQQAPLLLPNPATVTFIGLRRFCESALHELQDPEAKIRLSKVLKGAGNEGGAQGLLHLQCSWQSFPIS